MKRVFDCTCAASNNAWNNPWVVKSLSLHFCHNPWTTEHGDQDPRKHPNLQNCFPHFPVSAYLYFIETNFHWTFEGRFYIWSSLFFFQTIITQDNGFHHDIFIMNILYVFILFTLVSPVLLPLPPYPIPLPKNPLFYFHALKNNLDSNYELEHVIHASLCVSVSESFSQCISSFFDILFSSLDSFMWYGICYLAKSQAWTPGQVWDETGLLCTQFSFVCPA